MKNRNYGNPLKKIYIIIFCIIIFLPGIQMNSGLFSDIRIGKFSFTTNILNEKREKAGRPTFSINKTLSLMSFTQTFKKYTKDYESYINDNFGFRDYFINMANTIDVRLFHRSSTSDVYLGKDDYLYIGEEMKDYDRDTGLSDEDIDTIAKKVKNFQDKLAANGKKFIFFIAPDKSTIYPEEVGRAPLYSNREDNYDRLIKAFEKENVNTFDVKKFLLSYKGKYQLYYKRDTHWNNIASALVSNHILSMLKGDFGNVGDVSIEKTYPQYRLGDLDSMLGITKGIDEWNADIKIKNNDVLIPKTLGYFDSFSYSVLNILNPCFGQRIDNYNIRQTVENTYPGIYADSKLVYFEIVERYVPDLKKLDYNFDVLDDSKINPSDYKSNLKLNLNYNDNKSSMNLNQTYYQRADDGNYLYISKGNDSYIVWNIASTDVNAININVSGMSEATQLQLYYAEDGQLFDDKKSIKVNLYPSKKNYVINLKDQGKGIVKFRVDIDSKPNVEVNLKDITLYKSN